jgi:hypothetical protein
VQQPRQLVQAGTMLKSSCIGSDIHFFDMDELYRPPHKHLGIQVHHFPA